MSLARWKAPAESSDMSDARREPPLSPDRNGAGDADPPEWPPYGLGAAHRRCRRYGRSHEAGPKWGYQAYLILLPAEGKGMVVMTNSDNGSILAEALIRRAAELYGWPRRGALAD